MQRDTAPNTLDGFHFQLSTKGARQFRRDPEAKAASRLSCAGTSVGTKQIRRLGRTHAAARIDNGYLDPFTFHVCGQMYRASRREFDSVGKKVADNLGHGY